MITLRHFPLISPRRLDSVYNPTRPSNTVVCAMKGPRTRYPRVWKSKTRVGTISKSDKLVDTIKGLSNVKEEVYGALDSFIAWELEFPLIVVKKALDTLEKEKEWKRIIQVTKWMLSKGQGKTMGSYFTLLNALAQDGRLEEAEELWTKLFSENLEKVPRVFFDKIISIYYNRNMHEKMFEVFADMEELGVQPNSSIVKMMGNVFQKLDMLDKYEKLNKKYPPLAWEYRYIKGKRVKIKTKNLKKVDDEESNEHSNELIEDSGEYLSESDEKGDNQSSEVEEEPRIANEFDEATKSTNELKKVGDEEANKHSNELKEDRLSESDEESNKQHLSDVEEELTIPK